MTTLSDLRRQIVFELEALGIDSSEARRESELIIEHVTGCDTAQQILRGQDTVSPSEAEQLCGILEMRKERIPIQYCLGHTWFMGLRFDVAPGIFIPRADTETVVEATVAIINEGQRKNLTIAEIGIGSGAIAVSLLKRFENCRVIACDISAHAVAMADNNARLNGVRDRLSLDCGDWTEVLPYEIDCVVSNPPYIRPALSETLAPEVVDHEPSEALFGTDQDGLGFYRDFAALIPKHFAGGRGFVALEVGDDQSDVVSEIFLTHKWQNVQTHLDMGGRSRVVTARK